MFVLKSTYKTLEDQYDHLYKRSTEISSNYVDLADRYLMCNLDFKYIKELSDNMTDIVETLKKTNIISNTDRNRIEDFLEKIQEISKLRA